MPMNAARHVVVALSLITLAAPAAAGGPAAKAPSIEVQGHRGARALRPENTLPAFEYALAQGVDVLELDLQVTGDDVLVVMHDAHVNLEICDRPLKKAAPGAFVVRAHTYRELQVFDCGVKRNPRFARQELVPETRVPRLSEVFDLVKRTDTEVARRVRFNIETKRVPGKPEESVSASRFAELVVEAVRAAGMTERVVIQSFDHLVLREVKAREPKLKLAALVAESRPDFVAVARAAGADIISPNQDWITKPDVDACHRAGISVIPWTANTEAEWKRLVAMGVDGIITDDPAGLIRYMREHKLR